jgi:MATE family multidrug resistance protein
MAAEDPRQWRRRVGRLAAPLIVSNVTVPLLGIVDTAVVGHLDSPVYLGGVAVGALLFGYVYFSFGFLRSGTGGLVAQAFGAGDGTELRSVLGRAGLIALGVGALIIVGLGPFLDPLVRLVGAGAEVGGHAHAYAIVRLASAPATLGNYVLLGALIGVQRPKGALALMVATNGTNIVLDLIFVLVLGWGVAGVAAATVIAEYVGAAVGVVLVRRAARALPGVWDRARILDGAALRRLFALNRDLFLRNLAITTAFSLFTVFGARLGDLTLAVNAVLMNFHTLAAYVLDGFADAAEALVGQAIGRRSRVQFGAAVRACAFWIGMLVVVIVAAFLALGGVFIDVMTGLPEVRAMARTLMTYVAAAPLIGAWAFLLDGIFTGATRGAEMRNAMVASLAVFVAAALALIPPLGNDGLWLAYLVFMATRPIGLALYYPRIARSLG